MSGTGVSRPPRGRGAASLNRRILGLALPAFAALVAQPLFVLADTAIVGHLGTDSLAGLGVGSAVSFTVGGLFVFLAYGSTATVARLVGAGKRSEAVAAGVQAIWLGAALGALVGTLCWLLAPELAAGLGAAGAPHAHAVAYLRWSLPGLPGVLAGFAVVGTLRGLADGRTPMLLAVGAAVFNLAGDVVLVLGLGWGIAGAGAATMAAELLMGVVGVLTVLRGARRLGAPVAPGPAGLGRSLSVGAPLLVRTVALRVALLLTTWVAARFGAVTLAAHQVSMSIWSFLQYALDAVAIAGQTLIGQALGASRVDEARALTRRMIAWSLGAGLVLGLVILPGRAVVAGLFTSDEQVGAAVAAVLLVIGLTLPISAWVTLFDGVLIGAGDARYLARASVVTLVGYAPLALAVAHAAAPDGLPVAWLWLAFTVGFMGLRAATLWWRQRTDAWLVLGDHGAG